MADGKEQNMQNFIITVAMFAVTPLAVGFFTYLSGGDAPAMLRNVTVSMAGAGLILYMMEESRIFGDYAFGNESHYLRFACFYTAGLLCACASGYIPQYLHPFAAFAVLFVLLSNFQIGLAVFSVFLILGALLGGFSMNLFLLYFLTSLVGAVIFRNAERNFKIALPLLIVGSICTALTAALVFLFEGETSLSLLWTPLSGLILNLFLTAVILNVFSLRVLHRYDGRYGEINDPEYELLSQLKETDKKEYYRAIHTAYLSDKIARKLGLDPVLAKAGGYYHKIGILREGNPGTNSLQIAGDHGFPAPLCALLAEYGGAAAPDSKEAVVVIMSEAIVSSIMFLFEKEPDTALEYKPVIDVVFKKKLESGVMDASGLTIGEMHKMKQYYLEEALYYDFLR